MSPEERRKRMEERMASMTPEERERFQARMKEREAQGGGFGGGRGTGGDNQASGGGRGQGPGGQPGRAPQGAGQTASRGATSGIPGGTATSSGAMTIDSLFAPLQVTETRGRVWLYENKQLKSVQLRLGVSDGTFSEIIDGDIKEGQEVVTNMVTGLESTPRPGQQGTGNPLMGPQRGGPGGGGGRGGGGRGF
jgi:HlyD family secretion protein